MTRKARKTETPAPQPAPGQDIAVRQEPQGGPLMEAITAMCSNPDFDPAKMQQIIDMRKEMFMEGARMEFNAAMARAQARIQPVIADAENIQVTDSNGRPGRYAKLATIVKDLSPIYTAEGFSVSFGTDDCPSEKLQAAGWIRVTAELTHNGGYEKHYHVDLPLDTVGIKGTVNKTVIHGTKSAISYARVILMGLMFNFTTALDVDDDGNGAGKKPEPEEPLATDAQKAAIQDHRDAGTIPEVTLKWLNKQGDRLTEKKAAELLTKLAGK